jgi:hypothetical protein
VSSASISLDPYSKEYHNQSVWLAVALGVLAGLNNIVIGFKFMGVSYDRIVEIFIFVLLLPGFVRNLKESGPFRAMILILLMFGILRQVTDISLWVQGEPISTEAFLRTFVKSSTYLIFFALVYEGMRLSLKWFLRAYVLIVFLAGLMAFFQSPLTPLTTEAWNAKVTWFGANVQSEIFQEAQETNAEINEGRFGIRVAGPYQYSIVYSYALYVSLTVMVYIMLARGNLFNFLLLVFFAILVVFTLTRSLLLGAFIVLLTLLLRVTFAQSIGLAIGGLAVFIYFELWRFVEILIKTRLGEITKDDDVRRDLLALCGFEAVVRNPLGVTRNAYAAVQQEYFEKYGLSSLRTLPSHNGLVNIGFHFGVLGYFVFILWIGIFVWFYRRVRKKVRILFPIALLGYLGHTSFHNAFMFTGDYNPLIIIGLFIFEAQLGTLAKRQQTESAS